MALEFPSLATDENKFSPVGSLGNIGGKEEPGGLLGTWLLLP
jgi:hypothetical protein